jgi:acyl carrier protein
MKDGGVNTMWFTSSWFNQIVDEDITVFSDLQWLIVGGDRLSPGHIQKVIGVYPKVKVVNGYGPTENTTFSTTWEVVEASSTIPIGKPVRHTQVYILNDRRSLVPIGVYGEIYVAGAGLARGYLNAQDLTRSRFVDNPYLENSLMYRTGDIGRWTVDGYIEFLGRRDDQVKLRGFRIELDEIIHRIQQHIHVEKAIVLTQERGNEKYLVGYYTRTAPLEAYELKQYLQGMLPEYMVPAFLVPLDKFPLSSNGKILKRQLPQAGELPSSSAQAYVAPQTTMQRKLADLLAQVLVRERIGVTENFFELGGHSLKAIQLVSRIHKELELKVELKEIFLYPTVLELSEQIARSTGERFIQIDAIESQDYYALSHAQRRLWILDQLEEARVAYNIPQAYTLEGVDRSNLERSFRSVISRHEILRTVFVVVDGVPRQRVLDVDMLDFRLAYEDLRSVEDQELTV